MLGFLGVCSIVTQGYIVRKLLKSVDELRVLGSGLALSCAGLLCIGYAPWPWLLYVGLAILATGAGLVNPSTSGLISLYSRESEQGRMLGIFRSLGSLARAVTPVVAGVVFFLFGSPAVFVAGAVLSLGALWLSASLPRPVK
jgi:MFS family permease